MSNFGDLTEGALKHHGFTFNDIVYVGDGGEFSMSPEDFYRMAHITIIDTRFDGYPSVPLDLTLLMRDGSRFVRAFLEGGEGWVHVPPIGDLKGGKEIKVLAMPKSSERGLCYMGELQAHHAAIFASSFGSSMNVPTAGTTGGTRGTRFLDEETGNWYSFNAMAETEKWI